MPKTIAVDFDGVIHAYKGWDGPEPKGEAIPGALDGLRTLKSKGYQLILFTTRDADDIFPWLREHGFSGLFEEVTKEKPPFFVLIDDRVIKFEGQWEGFVDKVLDFEVYWEGKKLGDWTP